MAHAEKATASGKPPTLKGEAARQRIIQVAEELFIQMGFEGASMRDIAAAAKMQPASMYYYFPSKEELLWAVWEAGGTELLKRVQATIENVLDPWERLRIASIAHVEGLLDWNKAMQVLFVMPPWQYPAGIKDRVIALRDEYEEIFVGILADLPLAPGVSRSHFRFALIGALSWSLFWYKPSRSTPTEIAENILKVLRQGAEKPQAT